jgi:hypothetical protein
MMCLLDPRRTKRSIQYKDPEDVWNHIGGGKRLPGAMLIHTSPSQNQLRSSTSPMEHVVNTHQSPSPNHPSLCSPGRVFLTPPG